MSRQHVIKTETVNRGSSDWPATDESRHTLECGHAIHTEVGVVRHYVEQCSICCSVRQLQMRGYKVTPPEWLAEQHEKEHGRNEKRYADFSKEYGWPK